MPSLKRLKDNLTLPKLTEHVIDVIRQRGVKEFPEKLLLPTFPEDWVPVTFQIDLTPHEVDHDKYDYYFDKQHPWRPVMHVEKGESFDINYKCGNWVKKLPND